MVRGGNKALSPELILSAYASGLFPMADSKEGEIAWYSPDPRCVIPLNAFHVTRSLRRVVTRGLFRVTVDEAFDAVIEQCAEREETWINEDIIRAYRLLHRLGFAHSVEAWKGTTLCGGLYGVSLKAAFFGESMFSREPDASKVCLVRLVEHLQDRRFLLLDSQIINDHVRQFGAVEISRAEYLRRLEDALTRETRFAEHHGV